jgi:aerobic carbon-monoxide dehydrogenase large subunit
MRSVSRGVGESGILPVAAAIASAVEDALSGRGVDVRCMPLTAPHLHQLLQTGAC